MRWAEELHTCSYALLDWVVALVKAVVRGTRSLRAACRAGESPTLSHEEHRRVASCRSGECESTPVLTAP
jgi:dihydrodipicolinate synthase/N-acetylneuraminate lyase